MSDTPIYHHNALGIHPGAFVQSGEPITTDVQAGVLWVDIRDDPPYPLKVWWGGHWEQVGLISADGCLTLINGATICADGPEKVSIRTPNSTHSFDLTGYALPGGHRLEVVRG